jgi:hypothetical protein
MESLVYYCCYLHSSVQYYRTGTHWWYVHACMLVDIVIVES